MHCSSSPSNHSGCHSGSYQNYSNIVSLSSSYSSLKSVTENGVTHTTQVQGSSQSQTTHISRIDGFQAFERTLQQTYEHLSSSNSLEIAGGMEEPNTAEAVASNILGFIEQRLQKDLSEGASAEELEARLNQGLEGFKKGFAEAKQQIEALGWLNETVSEDIGKTYDLVLGGIEDLRTKFSVSGGSEGELPTEANPEANSASVVSSSQSTETLRSSVAADRKVLSSLRQQVPQPQPNSAQVSSGDALSTGYGHISYGQLNSFKFELETADGDIVTIEAGTKDIYAAEYSSGSYVDGDAYGDFENFEDRSLSDSRFNLSISGHLDEDELLAIDALLAQVEDLSVDFFEGDLEQAYQQALGLGYDTSEIVGFSLNLLQVEVERVTTAYGSVAPQGSANDTMTQKLQPLGDFVKRLLEGVDAANQFGDGLQLLTDLAAQIDRPDTENQESQTSAEVQNESLLEGEGLGYQEATGFSSFVKDLLEGLPSSRSAF